MLIFFFH